MTGKPETVISEGDVVPSHIADPDVSAENPRDSCKTCPGIISAPLDIARFHVRGAGEHDRGPGAGPAVCDNVLEANTTPAVVSVSVIEFNVALTK